MLQKTGFPMRPSDKEIISLSTKMLNGGVCMRVNEQRQQSRIPFDASVTIVSGDQTHRGRCVNISQGGATVQADLGDLFGEEVTMHLSLPGIAQACEIRSIVRWNSYESGEIGLQFTRLRPIEVWGLNELFKMYRRDRERILSN
jgi:hypothetical protein